MKRSSSSIEKHTFVKFASHPILGTGCPEQVQSTRMSRCCLGPTSHIWGCSKPSKGSNSQLAIDEATKTSLHKISPISTFPTWWELAPPSCLHSHITLGPFPLLRRPNKFGQPTRGSVGIRSVRRHFVPRTNCPNGVFRETNCPIRQNVPLSPQRQIVPSDKLSHFLPGDKMSHWCTHKKPLFNWHF